MVLGLSTSSLYRCFILVQVNPVNLYSLRLTANTDECTDIVVRKCALRH